MQSQSHQIYRVVFLLVAFLFVGTIGYHFIEGFDLIDSIYMTAVILSTVGFGGGLEELSQIGRLFTIILIILGVGTVAYAVTIMAEYVFENRLFRSRKMERIIENIKDHYIVCGYGRMGKIICRELEKNKKSFIVLDSRPEKVNTATTKGYLALMGDCLEDNFLKRAQLQDAKGLVVVLSSDENNLFVTLSARRMKQDLFIIAKTSHENNATKFLTAGANKVLNPYEIAGHSMANMLTRPAVTDFLEIINEGLVADWEMDEVKVCEGSALHNKQIKEAFVRSELDVIIAAIQKPDGKMIFNPSGEMVIEQNDLLIAMGYNENLKVLEEYCQKCDKVTK